MEIGKSSEGFLGAMLAMGIMVFAAIRALSETTLKAAATAFGGAKKGGGGGGHASHGGGGHH